MTPGEGKNIMNTLLVPAMLAAMIGAWLPAQLTEFATTLTEIGCQLETARVDAGASDASGCSQAAAKIASKPQTLAWIARWQGLADL
jgi:hypothetical protein